MKLLSLQCMSSLSDNMVKPSVIMCDSWAKYITGLCRRAKGRYMGQLEGEAGEMQRHSRLAQPNTHVCMKLECQHLIHAAGWWLWNKLCRRVAAAKIPLCCSRQRKLQQAVDFVLHGVMELFYGANLKFLHLITKMSENIVWESVFPMCSWATDSEMYAL